MKFVHSFLFVFAKRRGKRQTKYEHQILFGFQKSMNTNTEYYKGFSKSKYQIQIVVFGQTIRKMNTKYQIVYKNFKQM